MKKIDIIYSDNQPSRLDRLLFIKFPLLTNGIVNRYLRRKDILLSGNKATGSSRVNKNDVVTIPYFFQEQYVDTSKLVFTENDKVLSRKLLDEYLILSTKHFIAINKPAGLSVQGGSKIKYSVNSAINYLNSLGNEYKLVHRIDKKTSGILLIAKNIDSARILTHAFKERAIAKKYTAILHGNLKQVEGWILNGKYHDKFNEIDGNQYYSITRFETLKSDTKYSYISFYPITGRKHQLRKDALSIGHPIVGDSKYYSDQCNNANLDRLMLHATEINLPKALFGKEYKIMSNMPADFDSMSCHSNLKN